MRKAVKLGILMALFFLAGAKAGEMFLAGEVFFSLFPVFMKEVA